MSTLFIVKIGKKIIFNLVDFISSFLYNKQWKSAALIDIKITQFLT